MTCWFPANAWAKPSTAIAAAPDSANAIYGRAMARGKPRHVPQSRMGLENVAAPVAAYVDTLDPVIPAEQNQDLSDRDLERPGLQSSDAQVAAGEPPLGDLSNVLFIGRDAWSVRVVAVQEVGTDPEACLAALQASGADGRSCCGLLTNLGKVWEYLPQRRSSCLHYTPPDQ